MTKKLYLFLLLIVSAVATVSAQGPVDPVTWRASAKMTSPTEGVLTVRATINKGWHLYGVDMPANGPKPTTFDFSGTQGVKFDGPARPSVNPQKKFDEMFGAEVSYWENKVTFTRHFTLSDPSKAAIVLTVGYMGCNDQTCSPPRTKKLNVKIKPYQKPDGNTGASARN